MCNIVYLESKKNKEYFQSRHITMYFSFEKNLFLQLLLTRFLCSSHLSWEGYSHPRMLASKLT